MITLTLIIIYLIGAGFNSDLWESDKVAYFISLLFFPIYIFIILGIRIRYHIEKSINEP